MGQRHPAWIFLLLLLAACAPVPSGPGPAEGRIEGPVGFYPSTTGLVWSYLPSGVSLDAPGYTLRAEGPASFAGASALRFRFSGRGQERIYYRTISDRLGVRLLGYEETVTSSRVRFDPPFLEYPPAGLLAVGYRWGGKTTVESVFVLPEGMVTQAKVPLSYTFEVVGRRTVEVPAGRFEAYLIRFNAESDQGAIESEIWFVPHVGEVRTREGLVLLKKNF